MARLLLSGIAALLARDRDLSIVHQDDIMSKEVHTRVVLDDVDRAIQSICGATRELIQQLSPPERLVASDVLRRCGVRP